MRHFCTKLLYLFSLIILAENTLAAAEGWDQEEYVRVDRFGGSSVVSAKGYVFKRTSKFPNICTQAIKSSISPQARVIPTMDTLLDFYLYDVAKKETAAKEFMLLRRAATGVKIQTNKENMYSWIARQFGL